MDFAVAISFIAACIVLTSLSQWRQLVKKYFFPGPVILQEALDKVKILHIWIPNLSCFEHGVANVMKARNQPFEILTPDNRCVFVSSKNHFEEVNNAPDTVLSLQAAFKHVGSILCIAKAMMLTGNRERGVVEDTDRRSLH